ncbi:hypothetical protein C0995_014849 [Termitomyces sp. Mi166|nr:hypothetical protein C0995_014849 [Termitomyces sp. Mi166\
MSKSLTKVIYKPDHTSTDEYTVIVNPEEYKKWKAGAFDIFHSNQGHQGRLGQPSKQQLENDFGTSKDDEVVTKILQNGKDQGSDRIGSMNPGSSYVAGGR